MMFIVCNDSKGSSISVLCFCYLFSVLWKKKIQNSKVIVMNEISVFLIPFVLLLSFVPFLLPNHFGWRYHSTHVNNGCYVNTHA